MNVVSYDNLTIDSNSIFQTCTQGPDSICSGPCPYCVSFGVGLMCQNFGPKCGDLCCEDVNCYSSSQQSWLR